MFKKTLIAATLAAMSTSAMAVNVNGTTDASGIVLTLDSSTYTYGNEALTNGQTKNDFTEVQLNTVVLTLGAAYSVGDVIKVNITGAEFKADETYALSTSNAAIIDVGFLSATANQLVFRVTAAAAATAGETLTLAAASKIKLDSTAVGSKVTISATAETSTGITIDVTGATDSKVVGTVVQQHSFKVLATNVLDEKIDVSDERKVLTAASDTATVTYTLDTPTFSATDFSVVNAGEMSFTVNGSFTGYETGVTGSTNVGTVVIDAVDATVAADLQSGKAALVATAASDTMAIVYTPDLSLTTRVVLNTSAYTVDVLLDDGAKTTEYNGISLGSFVLNGASNVFAYVPVNYDGAVTTQFEIGNKGVLDGEITLTAFDTAGNDYSAILPFNAVAGKLTKISDQDISTAFSLTAGTKLNLTITVNSPDADITMAGYSNRGTTGRMAINAE